LRGRVRRSYRNGCDPLVGFLLRRPERRAAAALGRPVRWLGHHRCHALWGVAASGYPSAAVLVVDERGCRTATSLWSYREGSLNCLARVPYPNSLGLLYGSVTAWLGFEQNSDEWKVMGLAAYGRPRVDMSP